MVSDGNKTTGVEVSQMRILNLKIFSKTCTLKKNTVPENELQKVFDYPIYLEILKYIQTKNL